MGFWLSKLLPQLLYPLGLSLLLQWVALLNRRRRWAPAVSAGGLLLLTVPSLPLVSDALLRPLEQEAAALTPAAIPQADAIVVLGVVPAPPTGLGIEINDLGDRLICGVRLLRAQTSPLLLTSGGRVSFQHGDDLQPAEAHLSKDLAVELGVPAQAVMSNPRARTTAEEAISVDELVLANGWKQIVLVTSAFHMRRALASFQHIKGLNITPVACDFRLREAGQPTLKSVLLGLIPSAGALNQSTLVLKEHLGLLVYRLRRQA
jgi:uncharacterized SAM-binding protein YcdF (DUF218 family)